MKPPTPLRVASTDESPFTTGRGQDQQLIPCANLLKQRINYLGSQKISWHVFSEQIPPILYNNGNPAAAKNIKMEIRNKMHALLSLRNL